MTLAHVSFTSDAFDDPDEVRAQNINGIGGRALAEWLTDVLRVGDVEVSEVYDEDHGWDFDVRIGDARYHCACSVDSDELPHTGGVTIGRHRSMGDRLRGRNRIDDSDPLLIRVGDALSGHDGVDGVTVEFSG
jgi:hypothetical protein